jgi:hypothetical protein
MHGFIVFLLFLAIICTAAVLPEVMPVKQVLVYLIWRGNIHRE